MDEDDVDLTGCTMMNISNHTGDVYEKDTGNNNHYFY